MFGWIKNLFNKDGAVDKTLSMIDKGNYTDQEKANYKLEVLKQKLNLSAETRRWLAYLITSCYIVCFTPAYVTGFFNEKLSNHLLHVLKDSYLGEGFWSVVGLYFGLKMINDLKTKTK